MEAVEAAQRLLHFRRWCRAVMEAWPRVPWAAFPRVQVRGEARKRR